MAIRADVRAWLHDIQVSVAGSGELKAAFKTKPRDFGNAFPLSYIDDLAEAGQIDFGGILSRTIGPSLVVLDQQSENNIGAERIDTAVDALIAAIAAAPHVATGVHRGSIQVEDIDQDDPAFLRTGSRIILPEIDFSYAV